MALAPDERSYPESTSTAQTTSNLNEKPPLPPDPKDSTSADIPVTDTEVLPGLPRLNYNLWNYRKKLFIVTTLLAVESSIVPIALYYGLVFGTTLRQGIAFAIITSFFGIVSGLEFGLRSLKLIMKKDTYRPLGAKGRWKFDFTHMSLSFGYTIITALLIAASIPRPPLVKPLALPLSLFFLQMGAQLVWTGWMSAMHKPAPCKISSWEKGERTPPLVYTFVEDIVAVDGGAGKEYREALKARYQASKMFRRMIADQNWFWGFGSLACGAGTMVAIWLPPKEIAYGLGWGIPLIFSLVWTWITVVWVRGALRKEKKMWIGKPRSSMVPRAALSH
ncbi:hypothetical protein QBC34DRAFT_210713 [Podospora aff. communis PSN243]|uniref:Uncharacterized protein n=1 Tax=Podospora aff. communis PSN243 TaxID=3040156 RepID=A0AAV9G5Q7_9PEZI|nr:hypothetical protein QBC34DRAFT_210713 [Podospora aff. communis PSN243]